MIEKIKEFESILLLTHKNADIDAIASLLLLERVLLKNNIECESGVSESIALPARSLLKYSKKNIQVNPDLGKYDLVILLDTSSQNQLSPLDITKAKNLILIDHHLNTLKDSAIESFVDEEASSSTELVYRLFKPRLDREDALLLLSGILADSAALRLADNKTFLLFANLLNEHNITYSELLAGLETQQSLSEKIACLKGAQRMEIFRIKDYVIVTSKVSSFESSLAKAIVKLGADCAFVGASNKEARISARAKTKFIKENDIHLGKLLSQIAGIIGGTGSGHDSAAGANGPLTEKIDSALKACVSAIREQIK